MAVFEHQLEQAVIGLIVAHENTDLMEAISFFASTTQDICGYGLDFDTAVGCFHQQDPRWIDSSRKQWLMEEPLLDGGKGRALESTSLVWHLQGTYRYVHALRLRFLT